MFTILERRLEAICKEKDNATKSNTTLVLMILCRRQNVHQKSSGMTNKTKKSTPVPISTKRVK